MMTDYETVVLKMIEHLEREIHDHTFSGEMIHGLRCAQEHLTLLRRLMAEHVLGET